MGLLPKLPALSFGSMPDKDTIIALLFYGSALALILAAIAAFVSILLFKRSRLAMTVFFVMTIIFYATYYYYFKYLPSLSVSV
jgi:ABC-type multidrug transport system permease subunit